MCFSVHVSAYSVSRTQFAVVSSDSVPACRAPLALDAVLALFVVWAVVASSACSAFVGVASVWAHHFWFCFNCFFQNLNMFLFCSGYLSRVFSALYRKRAKTPAK